MKEIREKSINKYVSEEKFGFEDLVAIMSLLRSEEGCPWDREQNHASIRQNLIEECYEAIEAIDRKDDALLCEEIGDVLMQVVFHAEIAKSEKSFDISDVCDGVCRKLIHRHPHVFGDTVAATSGEVLRNWDEIKKKDKAISSGSSVMNTVSRSLPALMRAEKVQKKAKHEGFDFKDASEASAKLSEELSEFSEAVSKGDKAEIKEELGDLIFSAVNVARLSGVSAEEALTFSTDKFVERYEKCEKLASSEGKTFSALSMKEKDEYWERVKKL